MVPVLTVVVAEPVRMPMPLPSTIAPLLVTVLLLRTRMPNALASAEIVPLLVTTLLSLRPILIALSPSVIDAPGCTVTVTLSWVKLPTPIVSVSVQVTVAPLGMAGPLGTQADQAGEAASRIAPATAR